MGKRNKDTNIVQPRPIHHQQAKPHVDNMPSIYPHPPSPQIGPYGPNGTSFYQHPCGHLGRGSDERRGNSDSSSRRGRPGSASKPEGRISGKESNPINAELKVSIAAKHLAGQISESKKFWITFQEKYEREVAQIKDYVGDDILQQIWRKRIEYNGKYKDGENQDDEEFSIQCMKLETCLDQINEAAKVFDRSRPQDDRSNHDPRRIALEKIRVAGALVLGLAAKSAQNSAACANLVTEASNLEKLVDSKSLDAKVLHRFDRRKAKTSVQESKDEKPISTGPAPLDTTDMSNLDIETVAEERDQQDWP
ncbi:hypothetical protein F5Y13DRAFT_174237 [Hypoxylon sp. FL1857]|nr:hypothetical protein F5Y13DRAFT_174237 [Hypoxylon sp. FL1857]